MEITKIAKDVPVRLIDAKAVALMLGISTASFHRLRAAKKIGPQPSVLGRSVRWDVREITAWIEAKCPDVDSWMTLVA